MKRTKQRTSGSGRNSDHETDPWAKPPAPDPEWSEVESKPEESFVPFALSTRFAKGDLILHAKFGKGMVLGVEGSRIEVLFQDGKKKLGHAVAS
ncbi:MAG: hypothetical protein ACRELB_03070 [Polyangiaceae bacterium]